jgi:hypothetical protein
MLDYAVHIQVEKVIIIIIAIARNDGERSLVI